MRPNGFGATCGVRPTPRYTRTDVAPAPRSLRSLAKHASEMSVASDAASSVADKQPGVFSAHETTRVVARLSVAPASELEEAILPQRFSAFARQLFVLVGLRKSQRRPGLQNGLLYATSLAFLAGYSGAVYAQARAVARGTGRCDSATWPCGQSTP